MAGAIARLKEHPRGFWFVFWGEFAERASFYGMRTLLALYLVDVLKFDRGHSGQTVQFFVAACYLLTFLGGWLSDRFLGKYKTILYFSFPYILGHIILGSLNTPGWMYLALLLLALGSGSIKPNISPLMGTIYEAKNKKHLLTEAFSYFYAAVNIGAALTSLTLPPLRDKYGYKFALMFPTVFMVLALIVFAMGKKHYPKQDVKSLPPKTKAQKSEERDTLWRVAGIFTLISFFWLVYDQSASTWVFMARDHMNLELWPFHFSLSADQLQGLNPVLIVLFTPIFNWMWPALGDKLGKPVPAVQKMMAGFILVFLTMSAMGFAGYLATSTGSKVSVWWLVISTLVITMSELCVSVVGLEFAYTVATERTKSTVTAAFLMTVFVGNMMGGFFAGQYEKMGPGSYFGMQAAIMFAVMVVFFFVGRKFERRSAR